MKLPEDVIRRFKEIGPQIHSKNPVVVCKFYSLCGHWERHATEYYPEANAYYGYVINDRLGSWCYFSVPDGVLGSNIHRNTL